MRADALEKAEDLYAEMRVAKKQGKKYFSISIKDAVAKYLEFRKKDVGKGRGAGIVEGRYGTIKAHLNHFLNYVHKDAKVKDLGKNTLVEYEREGITTDYIRFRKQQKAADLFYGLQLYVFETPVYMGWVKFYMMFVFPLMFLALSPIYIIFMFIAVLELSYRKIGNIFIWTLILGFLGYFFSVIQFYDQIDPNDQGLYMHLQIIYSLVSILTGGVLMMVLKSNDKFATFHSNLTTAAKA
jgi:hypothetical protein